MNARYSKVVAEALSLSERERAELAASLIESLDRSSDDDSAGAWAAEISKRLVEVRTGRVPLTEWDKARRAIATD